MVIKFVNLGLLGSSKLVPATLIDDMLNTPILFLVFNRPQTTSRVFDSIREAKPYKLYIAADGSRGGRDGEAGKVRKVREIVGCVDWDCEVKTLFREHNLGLKNAVSSAIDWFFDQEEEGIILEDDCIPDPTFYHFCQDLLNKYRFDTRVMAVSGDNFQNGIKRTKDSYYFSRYPHCWGWATWKRAWRFYNGTLSDWPKNKDMCLLNFIAGGNKEFVAYWNEIFDKCYSGEVDSWAYPWTYTCWVQSGLTALPNVNLVSNIGFGGDATHTNNEDDNASILSTSEVELPLRHPSYVIRNSVADQYTDMNHFGLVEPPRSILCQIIQKIQRKVCS